jgi:hypothetical protein
MLSKCLMLVSLVCAWSCSGDKRSGGNGGGAGSESAGSTGHAQADASGSGSGGQADESAAGHGGLATGGATTDGAAGVAGGGSSLGGVSGAGLGGAAAGAGGAPADENPYGTRVGEDATDNSCPVPGSICHADFGCQPPCPTGTLSCAMPPSGGTAKPYCQQRLCRLDCGFGKTCPAGMVCDTASAFCTSNGL